MTDLQKEKITTLREAQIYILHKEYSIACATMNRNLFI